MVVLVDVSDDDEGGSVAWQWLIGGSRTGLEKERLGRIGLQLHLDPGLLLGWITIGGLDHYWWVAGFECWASKFVIIGLAGMIGSTCNGGLQACTNLTHVKSLSASPTTPTSSPSVASFTPHHPLYKANSISPRALASQYFGIFTNATTPMTGQNVYAWIDFDGSNFEINVTVSPVGFPKPSRPTLNYKDLVEAQRVLAWSLSDTGILREISTTGLPRFFIESPSSSSLSSGVITGIVIACVALPYRYSYDEIKQATDGFSNENLLGYGGFGRVFKAAFPNQAEVAVKCVNHDSKQGLREFMVEIKSMGRLKHKNLVQMRGWCRKGNEVMLVYDYIPNESLNRWILDMPNASFSVVVLEVCGRRPLEMSMKREENFR
ncbi:Ferric reduction oxidase 8 isoform 1 [Hibiscus syriacus]|uniref:Ferric reduction oxidase 8 isoform 1 n=1 Tax=Hibiscus syriacus TaxID=106335 RepID=A0A6A3CPT7_HIBSY|nr:Ferric reduction oxidase 8 isoform 1 [Hibiscus syriacus]